MVAALAKAGMAIAEPRYIQAAQRCVDFLRHKMRAKDGRLLHRWHAGRTDSTSFLDDHAYLLWGLLELHAATLETEPLAWALEVARQLLDRFAAAGGGFHAAPVDGEDLGARRKDAYDGALPSGNAVAAWCLLRLTHLTGDTGWSEAAEGTMAAFAAQLDASPAAFTMMLVALDLAIGPTRELVIAGDSGAPHLLAVAREGFEPRLALLRAGGPMTALAPWTAEHGPIKGKAAAYLCEDHACRQPTTDAEVLRNMLASGAVGDAATGPSA